MCKRQQLVSERLEFIHKLQHVTMNNLLKYCSRRARAENLALLRVTLSPKLGIWFSYLGANTRLKNSDNICSDTILTQ